MANGYCLQQQTSQEAQVVAKLENQSSKTTYKL